MRLPVSDAVDGEIACRCAEIRFDRSLRKVKAIAAFVDDEKRVADAFLNLLVRGAPEHRSGSVINQTRIRTQHLIERAFRVAPEQIGYSIHVGTSCIALRILNQYIYSTRKNLTTEVNF